MSSETITTTKASVHSTASSVLRRNICKRSSRSCARACSCWRKVDKN